MDRPYHVEGRMRIVAVPVRTGSNSVGNTVVCCALRMYCIGPIKEGELIERALMTRLLESYQGHEDPHVFVWWKGPPGATYVIWCQKSLIRDVVCSQHLQVLVSKTILEYRIEFC